jgi:Ca2+-binding RTX toxin-like protein
MRVRQLALVMGLGIGLGAAAIILGASPAGAATSATLNGAGRLTVTGTPGAETIVVRAVNSTTIRVTAPGLSRNFAAGTVRSIQVNAAGGNDTVRIDDAVRAFTTTRPTILDGGGGNDTVRGGRGGETLRGGNGNDTVTGLKGNDVVQLGAGADTAVWNTGQGNDQVEGGAGTDTQRAVGTSATDTFTLAPQAGRARIGVGAASIRTRTVETIDLRGGDGADSVTSTALTGVGVTSVHAKLGVDVSNDTVTVTGTGVADVGQASATLGILTVTGLGPDVVVEDSEPAEDTLTMSGGGGNDTLTGAVGLAAEVKLILDGGDGNDTLNGANGSDTLIGGAGNDTVDGNGGNDTAFQGDGNDTFVWDPGDGSDVVEGQVGIDTLFFNGAAGAEIFAASANGGRLLFTRNVGNIVMDLDDVEVLALNALGGIDTITVNALGPTDIVDVDLNLGVNGAGDASADAVTVNGTAGDDIFQVTQSVMIRQPEYDISLANGELANDTVTINASSGNDGIFSSASGTAVARYTFNGGSNDDLLSGTPGNDTLNGEDGNDVMFGNAGDDTFTGGTGTDTATGGTGNDINGGGIETFTQ